MFLQLVSELKLDTIVFFPVMTKPFAGYLADEEGIANAQKSLGLGNDDGSRRMR